MKKGKIFAVPFRRKREGRTYYKKRLKIISSSKHRFVVRKSLRNLQASVVEYNAQGDKVLFTVNSNSLGKFGWNGDSGNLPSAYLIGLIAGRKAIGIGVKDSVLDIGFNKSVKGSRLYAALAGAIDAGLKMPFDEKILPDKNRISGTHIARFAQLLKSNSLKYQKQFSSYIKKGISPEDIVNHFNEVKEKILHG